MSMTTQFPCPACGYAYTKTNTTIKARSAVDVRRRRVCTKCSVGFVTYEITASDYAMMQSMRAWMRLQQDHPISCETV